MIKRTIKTAVLASTILLGLSGIANATFTISAAVGGAPTGVSYVNFNDRPLGTSGGTSSGPSGTVVVGFTSGGQVVTGASDGVYAAPFISSSNGALFGDATVSGVDTTKYLTTGTGTATVTFPGMEKYMGLLWGSVDTFNTLSFYSGTTLIGAITGTQVQATASGDQGLNGTFYVNINSTVAFDSVVASSTTNAFEFDNVAYNPTAVTGVPEPLSLSLLGLGFAGLGFMRQRKAAKNA